MESFEMDCMEPHGQDWTMDLDDHVTAGSSSESSSENISGSTEDSKMQFTSIADENETANEKENENENEIESVKSLFSKIKKRAVSPIARTAEPDSVSTNRMVLLLRMNSIVERLELCNRITEPDKVSELLDILSGGIQQILKLRNRLEPWSENELATLRSLANSCSSLLDSTDASTRGFGLDNLHLHSFFKHLIKSLGGEFDDPISEREEFNFLMMIIESLKNLEVRHFIFGILIQVLQRNLKVLKKDFKADLSKEENHGTIISKNRNLRSTYHYFRLLEFVIMSTNDRKSWLDEKQVAWTKSISIGYSELNYFNVTLLAANLQNCALMRAQKSKQMNVE